MKKRIQKKTLYSKRALRDSPVVNDGIRRPGIGSIMSGLRKANPRWTESRISEVAKTVWEEQRAFVERHPNDVIGAPRPWLADHGADALSYAVRGVDMAGDGVKFTIGPKSGIDMMAGETPPPKPRVAQILTDGAATYAERNATYGDSYKMFGKIMAAAFPNGLNISGEDAFNRMGIFFMMLGKLSRMTSGNLLHLDSAHDIMVYSAMLQELIETEKNKS